MLLELLLNTKIKPRWVEPFLGVQKALSDPRWNLVVWVMFQKDTKMFTQWSIWSIWPAKLGSLRGETCRQIYQPYWKGNNPSLRGQKLTMVINHLQVRRQPLGGFVFHFLSKEITKNHHPWDHETRKVMVLHAGRRFWFGLGHSVVGTFHDSVFGGFFVGTTTKNSGWNIWLAIQNVLASTAEPEIVFGRSGWWVSNMFNFHPYFGKESILTVFFFPPTWLKPQLLGGSSQLVSG